MSTRESLLGEVEADVARYRRYRHLSTTLQWSILLLVTIAGFLTTAASGIDPGDSKPPWYAWPNALTLWGLIAAIGSLVVQTANPAEMAVKFEKKKDSMRALRTAIKYRNLDLQLAAELVELARAEPEQALVELSNRPTPDPNAKP